MKKNSNVAVSEPLSKRVNKLIRVKSTRIDAKHLSMNTKLDNWLIKKGVINNGNSQCEVNSNLKITVDEVNPVEFKEAVKTHKKCNTQNSKKTASPAQLKLISFVTKKKGNENNVFKKYGIKLPTVEEILQEKKELEDYKNSLDTFTDLNVSKFQCSPMKFLNLSKEEMYQKLDCKDLSFRKLSAAVKKHLTDLKGIMSGEIYNERHEKFHNRHKTPFVFSDEDLTYNTSMILFTYEQIEFMLSKLNKHFDTAEDLTQYFFQVLLPEICLRIFSEKYEMKYKDAMVYLDKMPLLED